MKVFFFIIWADPKFYNSLVFLSKHLSNQNNKIYLLCKKPSKDEDIIGSLDFGSNCKVIYHEKKNYLSIKIDFILFILKCLFYSIKLKPDNIICFNFHAALFINFFRIFNKRNSKHIYHNFDFDIPNKKSSLKKKINYHLEILTSKKFDYLIFPSKQRAEIFSKISKINIEKFYIMQNCFSKEYKMKYSNNLEIFFNNLKNDKIKIVCRMGSIAPNHYLEEIIRSFCFVDEKCILILAGIDVDNYTKKLYEIIEKLNLEKKIFIFKNIDNFTWYEILKNVHIGLCFYEENSISHNNMAGTSTKFNNYIYGNIPMITNDNVDFNSLRKKIDILETTYPQNPKNIATKINFLLTDEKRYNEIKKNLNKSFYEEFNFEKQYENSYKKIL